MNISLKIRTTFKGDGLEDWTFDAFIVLFVTTRFYWAYVAAIY